MLSNLLTAIKFKANIIINNYFNMFLKLFKILINTVYLIKKFKKRFDKFSAKIKQKLY